MNKKRDTTAEEMGKKEITEKWIARVYRVMETLKLISI